MVLDILKSAQTTIEASRVSLRSALAAAATDTTVPIAKVKELTSMHDEAANQVKRIGEWIKQNSPQIQPPPPPSLPQGITSRELA